MNRMRADTRWLIATVITVAAASLLAKGDRQSARFLAESHAAMTKMMTAMDAKPTGDVDADFVAMMIAHHQGRDANEASSFSQATPVSHRDRVYAAEQFSNTVSVTDPADNRLLGVIRLGDPTPGNLSPLYRGQLLVGVNDEQM